MTDHERFSDELLNAYVDGELEADDRLPIDQALEEDELLRERVRELKELKRLVREAYVHVKPDRAPVEVPLRRVWIPRIAASAAMFTLGAALTWGWLSYSGGPAGQRIASAPNIDNGASMQAPVDVKVLFHLSRDDPVHLNDVLNEAEALLVNTAGMDHPAEVLIIVSGSGLALFETGAAPQAERISALKRDYRERLTINGCGVAYRQFSEDRDGFQLLPEVQLVDLGVLELMRRQRDGWAYIHL